MGLEELVNDSGLASKESDENACQTTSDNTLVRETTDLCSVPEDEKREAQESCLTSPSQTAVGASSNAPTVNYTSSIVPANAPEFELLGARDSFSARRGNEQQLFRRPQRKSITFDNRRVLEDIESVREEDMRSPPQEPDAEPTEDTAEDDGERNRERDGRRASESSSLSSSVADEAKKSDSQKARILRIVSISVFSYAALAIFCVLCAVVIMWIERPSEQDAKVLRRADLAKFAAHYSQFCIHNVSELLALTTRVLELKDIVEELQPGFTNDIWTFDRSLIFIFTVVSSIGMHLRRGNHNASYMYKTTSILQLSTLL